MYFRIFVISQDDKELFNRAMNFNVGYSEAMKSGDFNCLVFHDVDLLPEDDRILYTCSDQPRHLSVAIDKFKYALPYKGELLGQMLGHKKNHFHFPEIFGGASTMTPAQYRLVNGFSNQYWGWGGEDDDMYKRIDKSKLKIHRYKADISRY